VAEVGLEASGHICQELAPFPSRSACRDGRLPGFHRASPSTPLDVSSYVGATIPSGGDALETRFWAKESDAQVNSVVEQTSC